MTTHSSSTVSLTCSTGQFSQTRNYARHLSIAPQPTRRQRISSDMLNADAFARFLHWLGADLEDAALKYESIRSRLIMMFRARRCVFAEDLADATFERVAQKLPNLSTDFNGDPAPYFYGVAKKIYLEYQRKIIANQRRSKCLVPAPIDSADLEKSLQGLDEALSNIPESDRELILRYYTGTGRNKITHRRALADQFGIGPNALRLRVFRIRREIKAYMSRFNADGPWQISI